MGRAVRTAAAAETSRAHAAAAAAHALLAAAEALDALADRQRVLDAHAQAFALPRPLPYQGSPPDKQVISATNLWTPYFRQAMISFKRQTVPETSCDVD